jgi:hypothetical protein
MSLTLLILVTSLLLLRMKILELSSATTTMDLANRDATTTMALANRDAITTTTMITITDRQLNALTGMKMATPIVKRDLEEMMISLLKAVEASAVESDVVMISKDHEDVVKVSMHHVDAVMISKDIVDSVMISKDIADAVTISKDIADVVKVSAVVVMISVVDVAEVKISVVAVVVKVLLDVVVEKIGLDIITETRVTEEHQGLTMTSLLETSTEMRMPTDHPLDPVTIPKLK